MGVKIPKEFVNTEEVVAPSESAVQSVGNRQTLPSVSIFAYKIREDFKCCFSFEWFEMVVRGTFSAGFTQPHLHASRQVSGSVRWMLGFHRRDSSRVSDVFKEHEQIVSGTEVDIR
jgi:hypothetical protein